MNRLSQMLTRKSFEESIEDYIVNGTFNFVTFDLETRDSSKLNIWNAEVISYGFCFTQKEVIDGESVVRFGLVGEILEDLKEEKQLLENILHTFSLLNKIELTGHNLQLNLPCKKGWRDPHGYDFRKIRERGAQFELDTSILTRLHCYDTMNVGFYHYDHHFRPRFQRDRRPKKLLRVDEIEEDFQIVRPKAIPKLGAAIRQIFEDERNNQRFSLILKYNLIDTVVEAIITLIFKEQMTRSGLISPKVAHNHFKVPIQIETLDMFSFIKGI